MFFFYFGMGKGKISIPSGIGGIVRYFDEFRSKLEIKPVHVVILIIIVIILELILHHYGGGILS